MHTKEELIIKLQELYKKYNEPITSDMIAKENNFPRRKVFERLFGSWQEAYNKSGVPWVKRKKIEKSSRFIDRTGEEKLDSVGTLMKIIKYNDSNDIVVEYQDEHKYKFNTNYLSWKKSKYKNPYVKTIYNVACIGNTTSKINGIKKESYKIWYAMIQRCYKECYKNKPTYLDCSVCEEWLCFENFEKWYDKNYYKIDNEIMHLDKDILSKGNKKYSPETCIFVPQKINVLFLSRKRVKADIDLPRGISRIDGNKFCAAYSIDKNNVYLGIFDTIEEAFNAYKTHKENHIKEVADKYKDKIPEKLYKAMYKYRIEIND